MGSTWGIQGGQGQGYVRPCLLPRLPGARLRAPGHAHPWLFLLLVFFPVASNQVPVSKTPKKKYSQMTLPDAP